VPLCRVFPPDGRQLRPSEETFSQHHGPVFCQHGGWACSADPANPFGVVCQQGMFCIPTGMPEARKYQMGRKPLRLCHSALHAHNVRPVRMYCTVCTVPHHVRERFDRPQVRGNEDLPLLSRPYFLSGTAFSPDVVYPGQ